MDNINSPDLPIKVPRRVTQTALISFWLLLINMLLSVFISSLNFVVSAVHAVLMIRLGNTDKRFRTAGIVEILAVAAANLIPAFSGEILNAARGLGVSALNLLYIYFEFTAYAAVLEEIDEELSETWSSRRDIYLLLKGLMYVCMCLSGVSALGTFAYLFQDFMGILTIVSPLISIIVISNYWKTAKLGKQ